MSTAPEADVTEHDGIEWKWCAQPGGSDFYDSLVRAVRRHTPRASLVLEIGVGAGYLLTRLNRDAGCVCVGLDILPSAIQASKGTAAAGGATLSLLRGTGFSLPIADSVFDVVMSHGVIEHYPPALARRMLAEHTRVCRPGGLVLVSVPNTLDLVHGLRRWWLGRRYAYYPERSYSPRTLARDLRASGLEVTGADGYAPLWSLRQAPSAYALVTLLHKTGLLKRASRLSSPLLLSMVGNLTMSVARKPGQPCHR